jgi:hypothetical protein
LPRWNANGLHIGIDVDAQPEHVTADVRRLGREAAKLLGA